MHLTSIGRPKNIIKVTLPLLRPPIFATILETSSLRLKSSSASSGPKGACSVLSFFLGNCKRKCRLATDSYHGASANNLHPGVRCVIPWKWGSMNQDVLQAIHHETRRGLPDYRALGESVGHPVFNIILRSVLNSWPA